MLTSCIWVGLWALVGLGFHEASGDDCHETRIFSILAGPVLLVILGVLAIWEFLWEP